MPSGIVPLINLGKTGIIDTPINKIIRPMILYAFRYKFNKAQIVSLSFSAIGLYILKVIAELKPNSAIFSICRIEVNKLSNPINSAPRKRIIIVRFTNGISINTKLLTSPHKMFLIAFLV